MINCFHLSDFSEVLNNLIGNIDETYSPIFFKIDSEKDIEFLNNLPQKYPCINIYDKIIDQLRELIIIRNPNKKIGKEDLKTLIRELLGEENEVNYGVWAFYPWENALIHILGEEEFFELRTSRNLYKITKEEQANFSKKCVGIIGLSVGQSAAITLAMERVCGEMRLADFDKIDLSNLNRIRTSIKNLSMPKAIVAAREIALIDPYIKLKCYNEGINEENIDNFIFDNGKKLDVIIEECDSVDIKILSRIKARDYKIPVVMDTNDRGMVDIERFDLDQQYPILHGLVNNLDYKSISNLSIEDKIKILGPIAGVENMSPRMKFSLTQIGKTITTWPQLASSVMLGGAIVTDTVRRIFNGEFTKSGRYYVDIESIVR